MPIDRDSPKFERRVRALMRQVRRNINTHGIHVTGVFPTPESPVSAYFCYTTGLIERDPPHPELATFGLDPYIATTLFNIAFEKFISKGHVFVDGERCAELANLPVHFRAMPADLPDWPLMTGRRLYQRETFPALQMVLPDKEGRFPWEPDCDEKMLKTQEIPVRAAQLP